MVYCTGFQISYVTLFLYWIVDFYLVLGTVFVTFVIM